jgi:hypothetical protein
VLVEAINAWYAEKGVRDDAKRVEEKGAVWPWSPYSLGHCLRKQAHLLAGLKPTPAEANAVRTFELGHQRGEALEAACKEIWPDARSQVPIRIPLGKFAMTGTVDLWIPSLRTIVDFKTQATFGFGLLDTEGVSEDYQLQIHAYRNGLVLSEEMPLGGSVASTAYASAVTGVRCVVVYEAKDSDARKSIKAQELKELEVPWSEELEERYQTRLREIEGMLIRQEQGTLDPKAYAELPLGPKGGKSWKCRFCSIGEERGGCYK